VRFAFFFAVSLTAQPLPTHRSIIAMWHLVGDWRRRALVQNGAALDSADHSGAKMCEGLRKSVRFKIGAAPVALQISGAMDDRIKVAVRPAE
jgi:hypothetical protein